MGNEYVCVHYGLYFQHSTVVQWLMHTFHLGRHLYSIVIYVNFIYLFQVLNDSDRVETPVDSIYTIVPCVRQTV